MSASEPGDGVVHSSGAQPKRLVELLTDEGLAFTLGFIYLHVSFILLVKEVWLMERFAGR